MTAQLRIDTAPPRYLVGWIPHWPIHALIAEQQTTAATAARLRGSSVSAPAVRDSTDAIAVVQQRRVVDASTLARAAGVRPGMREAEAQRMCGEIQFFRHDPERDLREFYRLLEQLQRCVPELSPIEPGMLWCRARGPARFYGDEAAAARALAQATEALGFTAQFAVADGLFTACQAALAATPPAVDRIGLVPPGGSAAFLRDFPIAAIGDPANAELFTAMGLHTLGQLAALPEHTVRDRCGLPGVAAWHHAHGHDVPDYRPRHSATHQQTRFAATLRSQTAVEISFDTALGHADELGFACAELVERFLSGLRAHGVVCTTAHITLIDTTGQRSERAWQHPQFFTASDLLGRLRWQATTCFREHSGGNDPDLPAWNGVTGVALAAEHWDWAHRHNPQLWSTAAPQRLHHQLSRLQSTLGYTAVLTPGVRGGRLLHTRTAATPWTGANTAHGASGAPQADADTATAAPLPQPRPSEVFSPPHRAQLTTAGHTAVDIDAEDLLTAPPHRLFVPAMLPRPTGVSQWSAPWPIRERWWHRSTPLHRLQLTLDDGSAWLLLHRNRAWYAEGRYH